MNRKVVVANMRRFVTECLGTFMLVFCGTGAVVVNEVVPNSLGNQGIAVVFGLVVFAVIMLFASVSGAHINPAVSLAFYLGKQLSFKRTMAYTVGQLLGAALASVMLWFLFPENTHYGLTQPNGTIWQSLVFETILTFMLVLVIFGVAKQFGIQNIMAVAAAVGAVVLFEAMFAGPICGASMNPARSFGPALISGQWQFFWIYCLGPFLGAVLAVFVFKIFSYD